MHVMSIILKSNESEFDLYQSALTWGQKLNNLLSYLVRSSKKYVTEDISRTKYVTKQCKKHIRINFSLTKSYLSASRFQLELSNHYSHIFYQTTHLWKSLTSGLKVGTVCVTDFFNTLFIASLHRGKEDRDAKTAGDASCTRCDRT